MVRSLMLDEYGGKGSRPQRKQASGMEHGEEALISPPLMQIVTNTGSKAQYHEC
jgi:hypothetical protein